MIKFQKRKKGLSTIVATLIIILLVLVAIGIIWVVIRNVIQSGTDKIDIDTKCISIEVKATKVECTPGVGGGNTGLCDVTVSRSVGNEEIGGIKLVFTNEDGESNYIHEVPGNMAALETKTIQGIDSGLINTNKIEVIVYFLDGSGNTQLCAAKNPFEF